MTQLAPTPLAAPPLPPVPLPPAAVLPMPPGPMPASPMPVDARLGSPSLRASDDSPRGGLVVDVRGLTSLYNAIYTGLKAPALRSLAGSLNKAMPLMQRAALVQAIASGVANGLDLMQGRVGAGTAVSRFTNDTVGAFVGGAGAAVLAGLLVGAFSVTGVMAAVVGLLGGLLGYGLAQSLWSATGIPGLISRGLKGVLGD
ncbi:MAG: hypothetical protein VKP62_11760 [Candidatus Sericytochromatia bacterium]|nr:hypothetical protein [Candidatus Sericytochromatia bacterium]